MLMKMELIPFPNEPEPGEHLTPWEAANPDELTVERIVEHVFAGCYPDPLGCNHCGKKINPGPDASYYKVYDHDQVVATQVTGDFEEEWYGCCKECADALMRAVPNMPLLG